eukprot:377087_1
MDQHNLAPFVSKYSRYKSKSFTVIIYAVVTRLFDIGSCFVLFVCEIALPFTVYRLIHKTELYRTFEFTMSFLDARGGLDSISKLWLDGCCKHFVFPMRI